MGVHAEQLPSMSLVTIWYVCCLWMPQTWAHNATHGLLSGSVVDVGALCSPVRQLADRKIPQKDIFHGRTQFSRYNIILFFFFSSQQSEIECIHFGHSELTMMV